MSSGEKLRTEILVPMRTLLLLAAAVGVGIAFRAIGDTFLIVFIAFRPASAAEVFKSIGSGLMDIATGFGDFFTNLVA